MHPLIKFSFKNLTRSKIRSGLSIAAVFLGVLLITTLLVLTDSLVATVDDSLAVLSGVIVVQEQYASDPTFSSINQSSVDFIISQNSTGGQLEGMIKAYVEEIWHFERGGSGGLYGFTQVIGLIPSQELQTVGILNQSNFINGRTLTDSDYNATVIGSTLAYAQNYKVGDYLNASGNAIEIVGIFSTDSFIDATSFMPIELVRTFSSKYSQDTVSTVLIKPTKLQYGDEISEYINNELQDIYRIEASDFEEIAAQGREFLSVTTDYAFYIGAISVIIGSLSVANAILMSVMERKREIAILKATGWSDQEVGIEVFIESLFISAIGGMIGLVGGLSLAWYFTKISDFLHLAVFPQTLLESYIYAVLLGVFAGLYPAIRAMQIDPVRDISG